MDKRTDSNMVVLLLHATHTEIEIMANLDQSFDTRFSLQFAPTSFLMRLGRREIFVCRDFRQRTYYVNPILDCSTGIQAGHLEVLFLRKWLIILSKANW